MNTTVTMSAVSVVGIWLCSAASRTLDAIIQTSNREGPFDVCCPPPSIPPFGLSVIRVENWALARAELQGFFAFVRGEARMFTKSSFLLPSTDPVRRAAAIDLDDAPY